MFVDLLGSKGCNMGGQPALLTILNIHKTGTNRAQPGQARYPLGASTVPNMGKHRAHFSKIGDHFPVVWFYLLYKINSGTKFLFLSAMPLFGTAS